MTFPPGVFIIALDGAGAPDQSAFAALNEQTRQWELQAARGECSWICADCCMTFPEGMPDACAHGHQGCTDLIQRDKKESRA